MVGKRFNKKGNNLFRDFLTPGLIQKKIPRLIRGVLHPANFKKISCLNQTSYLTKSFCIIRTRPKSYYKNCTNWFSSSLEGARDP